jgi:hypothetical protein
MIDNVHNFASLRSIDSTGVFRSPLVVMFLCFLSFGACNDLEREPGTITGNKSADATARINELVDRIHEMPNGPVHAPYTPAVGELIQIGPPVLEPMFELMSSPDYSTRHAAEVVIRDVTMDMLNDPPKAARTREKEDRWQRLWQSMGDLDAQATVEQRKDSVEKWRKWLAMRKSGGEEGSGTHINEAGESD